MNAEKSRNSYLIPKLKKSKKGVLSLNTLCLTT